jgi:hypothetical protein
MKTDTDIRFEGMRALTDVLGTVDAERFITLKNREHFDYTEWRKNQWQDESVAAIAQRARLIKEAGTSVCSSAKRSRRYNKTQPSPINVVSALWTSTQH